MEILIALPLIIYFLNERNADSYKVVGVFFLYVLISKLALMAPIHIPEIKIIQGRWNWSGKIYSILTSVIFLFVYRKYSLSDYFLTLKQNKAFFKTGLFAVIFSVIANGAITYFTSSGTKDWHIESILYQASMPGIDEEIMYRGIMLGLLMKILKPNIGKIQHLLLHPAVLITSLMFGLTHGFYYNSTGIHFNYGPMIPTFAAGIFWSWLTIRSGSILFALLSHNMTNTIGKLVAMRKAIF